MTKKKFITPEIKIEEIKLNLFSTYDSRFPSLDDLLIHEVYAATVFLPIVYSDIRLKTNYEPISEGLDKIMRLEPVKYQWKGKDTKTLGFLAQDVKKVIPEAVIEKAGVNMIDYAGVISLLVQAVKEQQIEIDFLKKKFNDKI